MSDPITLTSLDMTFIETQLQSDSQRGNLTPSHVLYINGLVAWSVQFEIYRGQCYLLLCLTCGLKTKSFDLKKKQMSTIVLNMKIIKYLNNNK